LGDRRKDGESNCNSGDGTGQMAHPWMFMMMNKCNLSFMMRRACSLITGEISIPRNAAMTDNVIV
jgi:hypothetical protein